MKKCDCYHIQTERQYAYNPITGDPIGRNVDVGVCWGTKERDECSCNGDRSKCDFYPEVREKAQKEVQMSLLDGCSGLAVGKLNWNPYESIIIDTDKLKLYHKDLGIEIHIPDDILRQIETIEVNGYKFVKEK